jgi:hypothetical protein
MPKCVKHKIWWVSLKKPLPISGLCDSLTKQAGAAPDVVVRQVDHKANAAPGRRSDRKFSGRPDRLVCATFETTGRGAKPRRK